VIGIKDLNNAPEFKVDQATVSTPKPLFYNTGEMKANPELKDIPIGTDTPDRKFNEFVCYD